MTEKVTAEDKDFQPPPRECNGCTACCEGWLKAEALGKSFYPGQPCHWKGCDGCTVYEDRPPVCSTYVCSWKAGHFLPEWFKPTESNVIGNWRSWELPEGVEPKEPDEPTSGAYLSFVECGKPMTTQCLTWLNNYVAAEVINVIYQFEGHRHWMGSQNFQQWVRGDH